jgi:DNA-binding CsgD family transcriptional regulator
VVRAAAEGDQAAGFAMLATHDIRRNHVEQAEHRLGPRELDIARLVSEGQTTRSYRGT